MALPKGGRFVFGAMKKPKDEWGVGPSILSRCVYNSLNQNSSPPKIGQNPKKETKNLVFQPSFFQERCVRNSGRVIFLWREAVPNLHGIHFFLFFLGISGRRKLKLLHSIFWMHRTCKKSSPTVGGGGMNIYIYIYVHIYIYNWHETCNFHESVTLWRL